MTDLSGPPEEKKPEDEPVTEAAAPVTAPPPEDHADELVKAPVEIAPIAASPSDDLHFEIDKSQYVHFVRVRDPGGRHEFILDDISAIHDRAVSERARAAHVYLGLGSPIEFLIRHSDLDTLKTAWRSRRAARRNT